MDAQSDTGGGAVGQNEKGVEEQVFPELSMLKQISLILVMTGAMLLNIMQVQGVYLSMEAISQDLNISVPNKQWLTSAYALAFGSLLLLFGRLADLYGHRKVFMVGMVWFTIWSIITPFAPNEIAMGIFRGMQGAGLGAAIPSALGILGSSFAPSQMKSVAFATFSGGSTDREFPRFGTWRSTLPTTSLTEYASWQSFFYVSAGLGALLTIGAWFSVPPDRRLDPGMSRSVDWIGAVLVTVGLVLLTFGLADAPSAPNGWRTPYIPTLFTVGALLLVAFWFWEDHVEKRTEDVPLMRTSLWGKGRFAIVNLIATLGWSSFASFIFFTTLFYQDYESLPPVLVTVRFLPAAITGIILNVVVALVAHRVPAQILIMLGCLGTGLAPLLFALQTTTDPFWQWQFPALILCVFGADFLFASGIMYVSKVAAADEQALAGGVFNSVTQIGTSIGLAIMTTIQVNVEANEVGRLGGVYNPNVVNAFPAATFKGMQAAFYGCTGFAFAALIVSVTCCYGIGYVGHHVEKMPASPRESDLEK